MELISTESESVASSWNPTVAVDETGQVHIAWEDETDYDGAGDDYVSTCGGGSSNDYAYQWVPPFDGWFDLNTEGSGIDTVLAVYEGNCNAEQITCNDDPLTGTSGRLVDFFEED